MVLNYVYHTEKFSITTNWHNVDGKSVIHASIIQRLAARHGDIFLRYWPLARDLDGKVDKLYRCIYIFNNEYQAVPYRPGIRRQFLCAFSDLCSCLERNTDAECSEQMQIVLQLFQTVQHHLQELVEMYLADHAYQNKYRKRQQGLKSLEEITDDMGISIEFEDALIQMMDISRMLESLTETQRRRLVKHLFLNETIQEIALGEGVSKQSVEESITSGLKKLRLLWQS